MKPRQALWAGVAGAGLALLAWLLSTGGLLWATLSAAERAAVAPVLGPRLPLLGGAVLLAAAAVAAGVQRWLLPWADALQRLAEQARIRVQAPARASASLQPIDGEGGPALRALATAIDELVRQREALRQDVAEQVRLASLDMELERNRLAALMSELTQSVVVCNLDGRVLLYNQRARLLFRGLSGTPALAGGAELLGLGRSIHAVLEQPLLAHALDTIRARLLRGDAAASAQFVTVAATGRLLRVQVAPVRDAGPQGGEGLQTIAGFVLMVDDVTDEFEQGALRDRLLHQLTEGQRGPLANLRVAAEMLDDGGLDEGLRQRFVAVIHEEVGTLGRRITELAARAQEGVRTRWPMEEMRGADLVAAAQRRLADRLGLHVGLQAVDETLWLQVDSYALLTALHYLAGRLADEFQVRMVQLRLQRADTGHAQLDLLWGGQALSTETVMSWELDPMRIGGDTSPLSLREVLDRHGAEFWFERERVRHQAFFRLLLPLSAPPPTPLAEALPLVVGGRPEFYDFDLFQHSPQHQALEHRPLAELAYTVFDTETTGLQPSQGDAILQIGATRITGAKLRRAESFEQLVDPQRPIPEAGIAIHGITPERVRGQPAIGQVLPAFHRFAQDTVLVAHNAAFDMRFLQLQQAATGCVFDQPVLDTLLLSAVVHPHQPSHALEAIAARFGLPVAGRHSALGDALLTAEVFLRLLPLLQAMGIHTLHQAREAAQRTYFARLAY
ncbi:3'-5' exonuclease [Aquincola tertiaricarbonis]|uniref:3'-5' exonuclease n=1 Tax=Aquincola tertiaricarbonis TaxID=391953 RepID=UPI000614EF1B|nr:exonuclease domain-containing protein [Aquincola tertiaricarbonis]